MFTWVLTPQEFEALKQHVAKINTRAQKRGFTGCIDLKGVQRTVTNAKTNLLEVVFDATLSGEAPSYNGWKFLAAVDSVADEFVLRAAPGEDTSVINRKVLQHGYCGHCQIKRPNRVHTYLVQNSEYNTVMQVGSTCIKDFLGWTVSPVFLDEDSIAKKITDFLDSFHSSASYSPQSIIRIADAVVSLYGWTSSSGTIPTRNLVSSFLYGTSAGDGELQKEISSRLAATEDHSQEIIDTLCAQLPANTEYGQNLLACLKADYVEPKHLGLVVSAVPAFHKLTAEPAEKVLPVEYRYAGDLDEKVTVTGAVSLIRYVDGFYGQGSALIVIKNESTSVKMFTTASWADHVVEGEDITVTGVVKAHEEFNGEKQTLLRRPKKL